MPVSFRLVFLLEGQRQWQGREKSRFAAITVGPPRGILAGYGYRLFMTAVTIPAIRLQRSSILCDYYSGVYLFFKLHTILETFIRPSTYYLFNDDLELYS